MIKKLLMFLNAIKQVAIDGGVTHQELNYAELLLPKYRKVFYETYDEVPEEYSKIFHVKNSRKAREYEFGMGAMGAWQEFGSSTAAVPAGNPMPSINYVTVPKGLERVYVHKEFAQGFMIERKFLDDEQYGVLEKMTKDLARAGRYKVETDAASFFNNAFDNIGVDTPPDEATIYDGKPLFAHDHPLLGGGTASNLIEGELSDENLKAATTLMRKTPDEAGKLVQFKPDTLVVPPELEWLAMELVKSAQKPGTNHNDINSLMGRFKIVVWDFLTDDKSWFIMDSKRHQASFYWRVKPEFNKEKDFDTLVTKWSGYMRYSYGASDWRGFVGGKGA